MKQVVGNGFDEEFKYVLFKVLMRKCNSIKAILKFFGEVSLVPL